MERPFDMHSDTFDESSPNTPGTGPPDGGFKAWLQVALCHFVILNTWGYINSFGIFQTYYKTFLGHSESDLSWIGSIQIFILFFGGVFSGRLTDAGYFNPIFIFGVIFQLLGIFLTSICTKYYQIFLAQGVCIGIGNCLLFCPALTVISPYFSRHRSLAIAIAVSGSGTGGIIFPAIANSSLSILGFPWTIRILGLISTITHIPCILFMKPRLLPRNTGPILELQAFKEPPYTLFNIGMFLNFLGLYFTFFYLSSFAHHILHASSSVSMTLLMILNSVGILGRLLPSFLADRYLGPLNTIIPINLSTAIIMYSWATVHSLGSLYAFTVVYGFFAAGVQSLFPAVVTHLTHDQGRIGTRMGMVFAIVGVACLVGLPLSGVLIGARHDGGFLYAQMASGTFLGVGAVFMVLARVAKTGWVWMVKA
ncbi:monocarboxylate transporter 1 [Aspergillus parasiticus SU-1]|uniref:Monocarboxylate transporter 1 n=1 Tax=Aspergillus parasiticus (strain ATCC 56775 / NRRL 5862 / SRRC 143 / SU-1) TaxID=1403190 RepID=A0A0F0HYR5_ASPPU|nr:monocarboxylate transporter 1 [Aspergillus parasiticus SU-1]